MKKIKAFLLLFILSAAFVLNTVSIARIVIEPPVICTGEPDEELIDFDHPIIPH
jgi:hypothetical protein